MCLTENWSHLLSDYVSRKQLDQYAQQEKQRYLLSIPVDKIKSPNRLLGLKYNNDIFAVFTSAVPYNADFNNFPVGCLYWNQSCKEQAKKWL